MEIPLPHEESRFKSWTDLLVEKAVENGNKKPLEERPLIKIHSRRNLCSYKLAKGILVKYKQDSAVFVKTKD